MKRFSIIVVDDDADTLSLLKWALRTAGYGVVTCSNAPLALRLLESWKPDLLITDLAMPGYDGVSLIKEVKCRPTLTDLPVLAISAYLEEYGSRALEAGATLLLPKPHDVSELLETVNTISAQIKKRAE